MHCVQVLYPWRRIFQQMFNHDRMAGPLYCMWEPGTSTGPSDHPVVTQLGAACRAATPDYAAWQTLLINTLDMQVTPHPLLLPPLLSSGTWNLSCALWSPSLKVFAC